MLLSNHWSEVIYLLLLLLSVIRISCILPITVVVLQTAVPRTRVVTVKAPFILCFLIIQYSLSNVHLVSM